MRCIGVDVQHKKVKGWCFGWVVVRKEINPLFVTLVPSFAYDDALMLYETCSPEY